VSSSSRSYVSRRMRRGFTLIEALLAIGILIVLIGIVAVALTRGLQTKHSQSVYVELQQNLRTAMQQITQDLRSASRLGLWNDPASGCSAAGDPCSARDRLAILVSKGYYTAVAEPPGSSYNNSVETGVCDASGFDDGDLVLISDGTNSDLVEITQRQLLRDPTQPCSSPTTASGGTPPNRDLIQHNNDRISGTWQPNTYAFKVQLVTYELRPDPEDAARTVLYRRTGLGATAGSFSGIVAFDVDTLRFSYGIPLDPSAASSSIQQLRFYDSLSAAASALGAAYTDDPRGSGIFVGSLVRAVRVHLAGTTPAPLTAGGGPGRYEITETVDLRLN